jgi:hypothetical protein
MKYFTIDSENNITVHSSRQAARGTGAEVFSTEVQFADLIGSDNQRLLAIWNSLPGVKPVTKFENRKKATERIWRAIQNLGGPAPIEPAAQQDTATPAEPEVLASAGAPAPDVAPVNAGSTKKATRAKKAPKGERKAKVPGEPSNKKADVIAMMERAKGATLPEIMAAMGWQAHTVRGFVSILGSKEGQKIESSKNGDGERLYRIVK